jgi:hypothetical protein
MTKEIIIEVGKQLHGDDAVVVMITSAPTIKDKVMTVVELDNDGILILCSDENDPSKNQSMRISSAATDILTEALYFRMKRLNPLNA